MVMQKLIVFKNTATLDETLYDSPAGRLSVRQSMILGVGCGSILMAALHIFNGTTGNGLDRVFPILPYLVLLVIPLVLALHRPNVLTMDELTASILMFLIRGSSVKNMTKAKRSGKGGKGKKKVVSQCNSMGYNTLEREFVPKEGMRVVTVSDFAKPTRLKLTINRPDGEAFVNHFVSIYLDGIRVTAMTTDSAGEVESIMTPEREGLHELKVVAKGYDKPVMDGKIKFQRV